MGRVDYRTKMKNRVIEQFEELDETAQADVLDKIKYNGALSIVADVKKTKTVTFGDLYEIAEERQKSFNAFEGFGCGLAYFDDAIMGFRPGEVIIISAPSNFGKTTVALNIITKAVESSLKRGLIISLEMTKEEIASRVYAISENHAATKQNIIIQTDLSVSCDHIERIIERDNPDIVMVDMLQKLANAERGSEYDRINAAMSKLKATALRTMKPIILISHVAKSRSGANGEATASDLKGSSSIEQDSDVGIMINKPDKRSTDMVVTCFKHRTKRPSVFHEDCIIQFDGIKVARSGNYDLYAG